MSLRERRAIVTVPGEMATPCWHTAIWDVPEGLLRNELWRWAEEWLRVRGRHGERFYAADGIHVYGPFATEADLEPLLSDESLRVTREEQAAQVRGVGLFAHYLLNAHFLAADRAERPVPMKGWRDGVPQVPLLL